MIIIDSSVVLARTNPKDNNHERACQVMEVVKSGQYGPLVITDHILAEVVTITMLRLGIEQARTIGSVLMAATEVRNVDDLVLPLAWRIFCAQEKGRLSLCDCATMAVARIDGIEHVATFDGDLGRVEGITVVDGNG